MRISDWSSDVCSSDLTAPSRLERKRNHAQAMRDQCNAAKAGDHAKHKRSEPPARQGLFRQHPKRAQCDPETGRAPCRDRVFQSVSLSVVGVSLKKKKTQ